jgi:hypothetical protein
LPARLAAKARGAFLLREASPKRASLGRSVTTVLRLLTEGGGSADLAGERPVGATARRGPQRSAARDVVPILRA